MYDHAWIMHGSSKVFASDRFFSENQFQRTLKIRYIEVRAHHKIRKQLIKISNVMDLFQAQFITDFGFQFLAVSLQINSGDIPGNF